MPDFVAVDGEALTTPEGEHRYVLLCNSEGESMYDVRGLTTTQCLRFLCDTQRAAGPGTALVAFGLGYDVNMWLGDLGRDKLAKLWRDGSVTWRCYRLEWVPGKSFAVSTRPPGPKCRALVYDVFGFFQTSFVASLKRWGFDPRPELEAMKGRRSTFSADERQAITNYCLMECNDLVELMNRVRDALGDVGIKPASWVGAGSIAAALMRRHGIREHQPDEARAPAEVRHALLSAYYGGRVELFRQGRFMSLLDYDVRSAYPFEATKLPSGRGSWRRFDVGSRPPNPDDWTIYRVRWSVPRERIVMPFPYRQKRAIYYPTNGEGWYHAPEVAAALAYYPEHVRVLEGLEWVPTNPAERPFAFVRDLYLERAKLKAEGHPAEKVLKLGLNSLYGKLAQGCGFRGRRPPYQSFYWAGRITSGTRARLFRLAMANPERLVMLATDGIFFEPPVELATGPDLGDLERSELRAAFVAQPGVYSATAEDGKKIKKSRGFFAREIDFSALWRGWQREGANHVAKYHSRRFVGIGTALHLKDFGLWRTWHESERLLSLYPSRKFVQLGGELDRPVIHNPPTFDDPPPASEPYVPKAADWLEDDEAAEHLQGLEQPLRDFDL